MRKAVIIPGRSVRNWAAFLVLGVMAALILSVFWQGSAVVISSMKDRHVVVLDPEYGGYGSGTISKQGVYEKELNFKIAERVKDLLKPSGIEVMLMHEEDKDFISDASEGKIVCKPMDLNHWIALANEAKGIFVSLHVNLSSQQRSGAETFYDYRSATSKRLAELIQNELVKIPFINRPVAKPGDFYVIKNIEIPVVSVELGYPSNSIERQKLQQSWYQEQLARAIAKGIAKYFGISS